MHAICSSRLWVKSRCHIRPTVEPLITGLSFFGPYFIRSLLVNQLVSCSLQTSHYLAPLLRANVLRTCKQQFLGLVELVALWTGGKNCCFITRWFIRPRPSPEKVGYEDPVYAAPMNGILYNSHNLLVGYLVSYPNSQVGIGNINWTLPGTVEGG